MFQPNMGVSPTRKDNSQQRPRANHILLWVVTLLYLFEWKRMGELSVGIAYEGSGVIRVEKAGVPAFFSGGLFKGNMMSNGLDICCHTHGTLPA